jgi:hypothetical protein
MKIKILSINKKFENEAITEAKFKESQSFSDYDAVVIDPYGLSYLWTINSPAKTTTRGDCFTNSDLDGGFGSNVSALFARRREELEALLKVCQGIIVCYIRKKETPLIVQRKGSTGVLNIYSWLPVLSLSWQDTEGTHSQIFVYYESLHLREGKEIAFVEKSHPFSQYFSSFEGRIKFESILKPESSLEKHISAISRNKVKEIVSFDVPIGGGKIVFIPPNDSAAPEKEAGVLIDCITTSSDVGYESPPPPWISKYTLAGESKYNGRIDDLDQKIRELTEEKNRLKREQDRIARFKGLLYEKGKKGLEPLVREAFKLIGFGVLERDQYQEPYDLYIKEKDLVLVGEIGATDNSQIDVIKYRQLFSYVEDEFEKGTTCKGILVANAFIETDPQERQVQFTEHVIEACKRQRYCMITTQTLFEIVKHILSKGTEFDLKQLKSDIINCDQEFILKESK